MTIFWEPLNLDNLAYDPTTATVVVRLCWAKADISDRPWRKFKNPADEDRQCKNKVAADKNRPFSTLNYTFTVSGNQPEGQYWARVLVIQNSSYVANGGSADAGSSPPTTDCDLMETNTNGEFVCETFQVRSYVLARDSCIYTVYIRSPCLVGALVVDEKALSDAACHSHGFCISTVTMRRSTT